jgi:hypothetical protein
LKPASFRCRFDRAIQFASRPADITGAGSTFAAPIYSEWASAYRRAGGGAVSYHGVGSTEGMKEIITRQVDFAGSDAPLGEDELAKDGLLQFPTVIGGVVPVVNLSGIKPGELTLSGPVLGDIYLGKRFRATDRPSMPTYARRADRANSIPVPPLPNDSKQPSPSSFIQARQPAQRTHSGFATQARQSPSDAS